MKNWNLKYVVKINSEVWCGCFCIRSRSLPPPQKKNNILKRSWIAKLAAFIAIGFKFST